MMSLSDLFNLPLLLVSPQLLGSTRIFIIPHYIVCAVSRFRIWVGWDVGIILIFLSFPINPESKRNNNENRSYKYQDQSTNLLIFPFYQIGASIYTIKGLLISSPSQFHYPVIVALQFPPPWSHVTFPDALRPSILPV